MALAWDVSSPPAAGYCRPLGTQPGHHAGPLDAGVRTTARIVGLTEGTTCDSVVRAYSADGLRSAPSNEVAATTPLAGTPADRWDLNRDGFADLVWQQDGTGQVQVWFMGGRAGDAAPGTGLAGRRPRARMARGRAVKAPDGRRAAVTGRHRRDPVAGRTATDFVRPALAPYGVGSGGILSFGSRGSGSSRIARWYTAAAITIALCRASSSMMRS